MSRQLLSIRQNDPYAAEVLIREPYRSPNAVPILWEPDRSADVAPSVCIKQNDGVVITVASDATPPSAKDSDAQWVHSLRENYPPPPPPVPPPVPPPPARWFLWTINPKSVASLEIPPAALFLLWVFWTGLPRLSSVWRTPGPWRNAYVFPSVVFPVRNVCPSLTAGGMLTVSGAAFAMMCGLLGPEPPVLIRNPAADGLSPPSSLYFCQHSISIYVVERNRTKSFTTFSSSLSPTTPFVSTAVYRIDKHKPCLCANLPPPSFTSGNSVIASAWAAFWGWPRWVGPKKQPRARVGSC